MRIAICTIKGIHFAGGIERSTAELARRFVDRGHEVTVYTMKHYGEVPRAVGGIRVVGVPCVHGASTEKITASALAAAKAFAAGTFDIVHFQHVSAGWAAWFPRPTKAKVVLQSHGIAWRCSKFKGIGGAVLRTLERLAVQSCDVLTVVSRSQVEYYRERYGVEAVRIPNGVTPSEPVSPHCICELGLRPDAYVLSVGRLSPEKGLHHLIRAFRRIKKPQSLAIVGHGQDKQYVTKLKQLARGDERIVFLGQCEGRLLAELFSNAALYVQSSELEGLSLALLEAMSYGNCCLVSDIPENLEVTDGSGVCFQNGNVGSLAMHLDLVIDNPGLIRTKGRLAKQRAESEFSWDHVASRMLALYRNQLAPLSGSVVSGGAQDAAPPTRTQTTVSQRF